MPQHAIANAQFLYQRFYHIKSFLKNKLNELAMACIFLSSKVEESPRRIRDVINVFDMMDQRYYFYLYVFINMYLFIKVSFINVCIYFIVNLLNFGPTCFQVKAIGQCF